MAQPSFMSRYFISSKLKSPIELVRKNEEYCCYVMLPLVAMAGSVLNISDIIEWNQPDNSRL